jgi:hypothetical protein
VAVEKVERARTSLPWQTALDGEACCAEPQDMSKEFASLLFLETVNWLTPKAGLWFEVRARVLVCRQAVYSPKCLL